MDIRTREKDLVKIPINGKWKGVVLVCRELTDEEYSDIFDVFSGRKGGRRVCLEAFKVAFLRVESPPEDPFTVNGEPFEREKHLDELLYEWKLTAGLAVLKASGLSAEEQGN